MKISKVLSVSLALVTALALSTTAFAATPAPATKTITYNSYQSENVNAPATVKITNVTNTETKDFSLYLSDDKKTIEGKQSQVLTCKGPVTITLMPNKGEKGTGAFAFKLSYDGNKVSPKTVSMALKYYKLDWDTGIFNTSKKLTKSQAGDSYGIADGSTLKITKAGTYVLWVDTAFGVDKDSVERTPVFLVVK